MHESKRDHAGITSQSFFHPYSHRKCDAHNQRNDGVVVRKHGATLNVQLNAADEID
jgi:hypothetical protein